MSGLDTNQVAVNACQRFMLGKAGWGDVTCPITVIPVTGGLTNRLYRCFPEVCVLEGRGDGDGEGRGDGDGPGVQRNGLFGSAVSDQNGVENRRKSLCFFFIQFPHVRAVNG